MADQEDVEETCRKARDTVAAAERLLAEAQDPSRNMGRLLADWSKEVDRAKEVVKTKGAPPETGMSCLLAVIDAMGDMGEIEAAATDGLVILGQGKEEASGAPRGGVRRGMRV
jgi:hypothetical protein